MIFWTIPSWIEYNCDHSSVAVSKEIGRLRLSLLIVSVRLLFGGQAMGWEELGSGSLDTGASSATASQEHITSQLNVSTLTPPSPWISTSCWCPVLLKFRWSLKAGEAELICLLSTVCSACLGFMARKSLSARRPIYKCAFFFVNIVQRFSWTVVHLEILSAKKTFYSVSK